MKIILNTTIAMSVCLIASISNAQVQKGNEIEGGNPGDEIGSTISMPDVNTIAIGAPNTKYFSGYKGHVQVHEWNGSSWSQKGLDIDGKNFGDNIGHSVSMPNSATIVIGSGIATGLVRVYEWNGSNWIQKGNDVTGMSSVNYLGQSVSMPDENTFAAGAVAVDSNRGEVRVFEWSSSNWSQKGNSIQGEAKGDEFGHSVSMPNSTTVAIGSTSNNGSGTFSGHVRVFDWVNNDWKKRGGDIDGEASYDRSGQSISMPDANTIAIGAPINDDNGSFAGHVRIFQWNGSSWTQKGNDIDGNIYEQSGTSVSMPDENTIAIGAPRAGRQSGGTGTMDGVVRVYSWDGNSWNKLIADIQSEAAGDRNGTSVSMPDAKTVAMGATHNGGSAGILLGHARIFKICDQIDVSVTYSFSTLEASVSGASYQWLDCNDNDSPINGATDQSYSPTGNGSYAVAIDLDGCLDTSDCYDVTTVGLAETAVNEAIRLYPNPVSNELTIQMNQLVGKAEVKILSLSGQRIKTVFDSNVSQIAVRTSDLKAGIYFVEIVADQNKSIHRITKE